LIPRDQFKRGTVMKTKHFALTLSLAVMLCMTSAFAQTTYDFQTINYPGDTFTQLLGINNSDDIAGYHPEELRIHLQHENQDVYHGKLSWFLDDPGHRNQQRAVQNVRLLRKEWEDRRFHRLSGNLCDHQLSQNAVQPTAQPERLPPGCRLLQHQGRWFRTRPRLCLR